MAFKKKPYKWNLVTPGDIISFKYKSLSGENKGERRFHTLLVLNPRFITSLKEVATMSPFFITGSLLTDSVKAMK